MEDKKEYRFYGWQDSDVPVVNEKYEAVENPRHLYDLLSEIWCRYSCTPRMRDLWNEDNRTAGQCTITSVLVKDIFGGRIWAMPLDSGGFHHYNEVDGHIFDLASEQFHGKKLVYDCRNERTREELLEREERRQRYQYLKTELEKKLGLGADESL